MSVPPARLRAMVGLLGPDEMTPVAKRQLLALADDADAAPAVEAIEALLAAAKKVWITHSHTSWCEASGGFINSVCDCGIAEMSTALQAIEDAAR